jgi:hypothetical protein
VTFPRPDYPAGQLPAQQPRAAKVCVLEGMSIQPTRPVAGAEFDPRTIRAILQGRGGALRFDDGYLSKHVLFLGGIGTGKTTAMQRLVRALRNSAGPDDVFVVFDTKGDFLREFWRDGDAVISSYPAEDPGGVIWNLFSDLLEQDKAARKDHIYEIASTVFSADLDRAGDNSFFATGACDIFAAAVEILAASSEHNTNEDLRLLLEESRTELLSLLRENADVAGTARYLEGERGAEPILAFLQQTLNKSFSGVFRMAGDFSVRDFIRRKGGRALFIEYDIAMGSRLLPVYRVLMDMAIKEALSLGRQRAGGSVHFILDEFSLLPRLSHLSDGINFGRSLGLKFAAGTQNVSQVLNAYGADIGASILSGFGTIFAFRLMDSTSRDLVRQRFGANRKQLTTYAAVRSEGVLQTVVMGNVIEDWDLSALTVGETVTSLPDGAPFFFAFPPDPPSPA